MNADDVVLGTKGIVKDFPGVRALKGVDFDVKRGEVHALCGENGAGKSTLMHILAGVYEATEGEVYLNGELVHIKHQRQANEMGIAIVYQERSLVSGMSVAENIFAGRQPVKNLSRIDWKKMYAQSHELLSGLGIDVDPKTTISKLSPAQQQMVEIAKALSVEPDVLILDEPTATITEKEVAALFQLIKQLETKGIAIIYISHRLAEIFQIADRVTVFKDGENVACSDVMLVDNDWLVSKMVGRDLKLEHQTRDILDDTILECKNFNSERFRDVNFFLKRGEILSFSGLAGAGRTEVMRALFGADPKLMGEVYIDGKRVSINSCKAAIEQGIGYLPEDRKAQGLFLEMSIARNIGSASLKKLSRGINLDNRLFTELAEKYRTKLRIMTPSIHQKTINLSGGNQQKVVLAKWMMVQPRIMIIDEPTRGVDVGAKAEIYDILRSMTKEGTSVIVVSSDLPEVLAISDRVYVMHEGEIRGCLDAEDISEELIMKYASGIISTGMGGKT